MFLRLFSFLSFFSLLFFIGIQNVSATSEYFSREYNVVYTVKEDGMTEVGLKVTLTNKTSDYFASSDTITVGFPTITDVTARDPDGLIKPIVTKIESGNSIELPFNKRVVGKDKSLIFEVTFQTPDIARKSGKIWEINIPGIANPDEFSNFTAEVKVPQSFGDPTYIKPYHPENKLVFTKDQLKNSGISVTYGNEQLYTFSLMYHLHNRNVFPIRTEIALPPSTNYQEVSIDSMNPRPNNVTIDEDGNWLAEYQLAPAQKIDVQVTGKAKVSLTPRQESLTERQFAEYTKERTYWQANNAQIKKLAKELKTPQKIYEYVVEHLEYDFNRISTDQKRLGAVQALKENSSAVCLEFTDLFIAIARAAGIPTREINGYAHTENAKQRPLSDIQDVLHSWPEYYDAQKKTWIMVDPTWGNTTGGTDYFEVFDFDHIVFVRKGMNSQYPIPAGGYKFNGDEEKRDISVQFATTFPSDLPKVELSSEFPEKSLSGLPFGGTVTARNTGHMLFPSQKAVVLSDGLSPRRQEVTIPSIPPYGSRDIDVVFHKTPLFTNSVFNFTFNVQDTIIQKSVIVTPFLLSRNTVLGGIAVVIFSIIISFLTVKAWRLFVSR